MTLTKEMRKKAKTIDPKIKSIINRLNKIDEGLRIAWHNIMTFNKSDSGQYAYFDPGDSKRLTRAKASIKSARSLMKSISI